MDTMELFTLNDSWYCKHTDPNIISILGNDTIMTAYSASMPAAEVLAKIKALNPDRNVILKANNPPKTEQQLIDAAITKGFLSASNLVPNYAGNYMCTGIRNNEAHFKHIVLRVYIRINIDLLTN